jgi:hypothetical protein
LIIGQDLMTEIQPENNVVVAAANAMNVVADGEARRHQPSGSTSSIRDALGGGVRITQTLYQSQRRWIGIGWTSNLFPNERYAWSTSPPSSPHISPFTDFCGVGQMKLNIQQHQSTISLSHPTKPSLTLSPREKKLSASRNGNG